MKIRILFIMLILFVSCSDNYTPKPRAFYKLELPKKEYHSIASSCPFTFELPNYSVLISTQHPCLFDIDFPGQNGRLHITYLPLTNNLYQHTEQSRKLAYKHNVMADGISEQLYVNDSLKVYGMLYDYSGVTATAIQFFLTDSANHFFRGALYFNTEVCDSILPLNNFLKQDVKYLIESFRWIDK
jgi:gliding motility-associated lipoprotein GldD